MSRACKSDLKRSKRDRLWSYLSRSRQKSTIVSSSPISTCLIKLARSKPSKNSLVTVNTYARLVSSGSVSVINVMMRILLLIANTRNSFSSELRFSKTEVRLEYSCCQIWRFNLRKWDASSRPSRKSRYSSSFFWVSSFCWSVRKFSMTTATYRST